jgi:hypothetical protein
MAITVKKVLADYPKARNAVIRVSIANNGRDDYLDIREVIQMEDGREIYTTKGIWIPWDALVKMNEDRVMEAAEEVMDELAAPKKK